MRSFARVGFITRDWLDLPVHINRQMLAAKAGGFVRS
jgi:hypothetical protein